MADWKDAMKARPSIAREHHRCRMEYSGELAKHSSHIGSRLSPENIASEVDDTIAVFLARHAASDLIHFLSLLRELLEERGRGEAVRVLSGRLDTLMPTAAIAKSRGS